MVIGYTRICSLVLSAVLLAVTAGEQADAADWSPFVAVPTSVGPPEVEDEAWRGNPIDRFVFAKLRAQGLQPAEAVDRATWLRRVTYDLTGLPPTPEHLQSFVQDPAEDAAAYSAVVDRLLASPQFGEHWARHWLDVVRYADTDGFAIDGERYSLWRYRDYIIRAINEDRPFDQLIREQVAGDELDAGPEGVVASSFFRLGPYEADNMTPENRRQDFLNEMTSAVSSVFLGLTVGCARCHDHKYDPIPQADFYRLQAFLQPYDRKDLPAKFLDSELTDTVRAQQKDAAAKLAKANKLRDDFKKKLRLELANALKAKPEQVTDALFEKALKGEKIPLDALQVADKEKDAAEQESKDDTEGEAETDKSSEEPVGEATTKAKDPSKPAKPATFEFAKEKRDKLEMFKTVIKDFAPPKRFQMIANGIVAKDKIDAVADTYVLGNGDPFAKEGVAVTPGCLSAVPNWSEELTAKLEGASKISSGRRRILADWLASPSNPLTPRVYVNRLWQFHFTTGIVQTANDFGENGSGPSHPELLDYLARQLINDGWRSKPLHRMIVLSRTYRTATSHPHWSDSAKADPDNRLLWRAPLRRLSAESIRDSLLAVSGQLNPAAGGPGFFDVLPAGMGSKWPFFSWTPSPDEQRHRRSVYMFQRRNLVHPVMEAFDAADASQSCERRGNSVTAAQSLAMFNGEFVRRAAEQLAEKLKADQADDKARISRLFQLAYGRAASESEIDLCERFLDAKLKRYRQAVADEASAGKDSAEETKDAPDKAKQAKVAGPEKLALRDLCLVTLCANEFLYLD